MKQVILTGASGMIGGLILQECLNSSEIEGVTSVVRRPSGMKHAKLTELVHADFTNFTSIKEYFRGKDVAYYCVGVYTGAVPRDEFRKITVDYTQAFADQLLAESPEVTFCFLSGAGADQTEKSRMVFAKDKGVAENFLRVRGFKALYIFRPGYIYPVTPRKEPNFSYRLSRWLYPLLKLLMPNGVVTSEHLARSMFVCGLNGSKKNILENKDICQLPTRH